MWSIGPAGNLMELAVGSEIYRRDAGAALEAAVLKQELVGFALELDAVAIRFPGTVQRR